jgi:ATP-dependent protease ClpP protease subunit
MISAVPSSQPKPIPVFPNPGRRPEGSGVPIGLNFYSCLRHGTDIALGKVPEINAALFLRAIEAARTLGRSVQCKIHSVGGNTRGHLAVATALLQHPYSVHARVVGRCASAATFVALAADTRTIVSDGYVLLHRSRRICTPEQWDLIRRSPSHERQAINDSLNDDDDAQVALLTQRLGVSEGTARQWMAADERWTATEALDRGFVHEVDGEGSG